MTKIEYLLFDLDGTLLHFDMQQFTGRYLEMIGDHFPEVRPAQRIPALILQGTNLMLQNQDSRLNVDVFLDFFSGQVNLAREVVWDRFIKFYQSDFKSLVELTRPDAQARSLLEKAIDRGYRLVLATQPVFPLLAVRQRLTWAKIDDIPFDLITHIENMHACKPSPLYFKEIMTLLRAVPEQCLMIGNELQTDMASRQVGIKSFLLSDSGEYIRRKEVDYSGKIKDLARLLDLPLD